eukprot:s1107_g18.t1
MFQTQLCATETTPRRHQIQSEYMQGPMTPRLGMGSQCHFHMERSFYRFFPFCHIAAALSSNDRSEILDLITSMISWRLLSVLCILGAERYAETTEITCDEEDTDTSGAASDASLLQMNLKLNSLPPACRIWQHTYVLNASCEHFGLGQAAGFLVSGASRSGTRFLTDLFQGLGSLENRGRGVGDGGASLIGIWHNG